MLPVDPSATPLSDEEIAELLSGLERRPLALAVSGGADSVALMHLAARWASSPRVCDAYAAAWRHTTDGDRLKHDPVAPRVQWAGLQPPPWLLPPNASADAPQPALVPPHVVVLTVDHGLRPESVREAAFVAEEADKLGLSCMILRWDGVKPETGVQDAARNARRKLMLDVLRAEAGVLSEQASIGKHGFVTPPRRSLLMAHHQDDQAETVLMRLARGSGLEGLGGIRPSVEMMCEPTPERPEQFSVTVERPLLGVAKARLVATLRAHGARWIEDPSNENQRFERVRMRGMLAQMSAMGLTAEKIALSARRLRESDDGLAQLWSSQDPEAAGDVVHPHYGEIELDRPMFAARYVLVRTLRWLTRIYGGASRAAELSQLEDLADLLCDPDRRAACRGRTLAGCKFEVHGPWGCRLRVYREGAGEGLASAVVAPGRAVDWDGGRFTVKAREGSEPGGVVRALGLERWADLKRSVPALATLSLPAEAMATLPIVVRADGRVIAYCGIDELMRARQTMFTEAVRRDWEVHAAGPARDFTAAFPGLTRAKW